MKCHMQSNSKTASYKGRQESLADTGTSPGLTKSKTREDLSRSQTSTAQIRFKAPKIRNRKLYLEVFRLVLATEAHLIFDCDFRMRIELKIRSPFYFVFSILTTQRSQMKHLKHFCPKE